MEDITEITELTAEEAANNKKAWAGYTKAQLELTGRVKVMVEQHWDILMDSGHDPERGTLRSLYHFRDADGEALCRLKLDHFKEIPMSELKGETCCLRCAEITLAMAEGWTRKEKK